MKPTWKKTLSAAVISASVLLAAAPASVLAEEASVSAEQQPAYKLTDTIRVEVKSVMSELVSNTTRIGAVVRLYNDGTRVTRVPDYDVRVTTAEGIEYKLRPSAANAKAIQAKERVELSYMLTLDRGENMTLDKLTWVEVNEYVYPKEETTVLTVPVSGIVWRGADADFTDASALKQWGETFSLPVLSDALRFTPVTLVHEKTPKGPVTVVTLIAENAGDRTEIVPDFRIDGKSDSRTYSGQRVETEVELKPGEKKYMHYAILTENNVELNSLNVLTPETFVQLGPDGKPNPVNYTVGRLNIALPKQSTVDAGSLSTYKMRDRIAFDPMNKLIDKETEVSLVDLSMNETEGSGYKTIVAKFLVKNNSERPAALPPFQAELTNAQGFNYYGTRQNTVIQQMMPKLSYVVNYSFAVPSSETGEALVMKLLDNQTAAPYNIPIAGFKVAVQKDDTSDDTLSFYPYLVKMNYFTVAAQGSAAGYTYKMKMDLDIKTVDDVVADPNAANMKIELVDPLGRMIASQTLPFTGQNRLISGAQHIVIPNLRTDQFEWPLTIHIYEAIQTPNGEAKRLVKTIKQ